MEDIMMKVRWKLIRFTNRNKSFGFETTLDYTEVYWKEFNEISNFFLKVTDERIIISKSFSGSTWEIKSIPWKDLKDIDLILPKFKTLCEKNQNCVEWFKEEFRSKL